jgi:RNA polymerase sigma-70 factor (ECF subfamily)
MRARTGRAKADLEQAYDEHGWRLFGFFAYRVSSRADAEDLTQLTFERALAAWESFDPARASVGTWLFAIARNLLIDHRRAVAAPTRRVVPLDALDPSSEPSAPGPEGDLGLSPEIAAALAQLSDREREILALRFGGELGGPEIAAATGLSLANVQQIVSRSLRKLWRDLEGGEAGGQSTEVRAPSRAGADLQKASGPTPANPVAAKASSSDPDTA